MERIEDRILAGIDRQEITDLALTLGNIYSPTGREGDIAAFVYDWMEKNGFEPRFIGPTAERANVLGRHRGSGNGLSLQFNSHMDITMGRNEVRRLRDPDQPVYYEAWVEGESIWGNGVVNDKGPMASWMIAVKALKETGVELKGDILMGAVIGEIGYEPVDEFVGLEYIGKDFGTRYLLTHGGTSDLAIVAEATNFKAGWVEAGKAFFKITVQAGPSRYTPYVEHGDLKGSKNAIVKAAALIPLFEEWAKDYETRYRTQFEGGTVVPKASIGAIRAGLPYQIIRPPEVCDLYVDVRLVPGTRPLDIRQELASVLYEAGIEGEVQLFLHRPGFQASGIEGLLETVGKAHQAVCATPMVTPPEPSITSMWRDTNIYAEFGIPALNYGPGGGGGSGQNSVLIDDLVKAARIFALAAFYTGQLSRSDL
jgi:acetylornithine deacetylase/succinyl-diaminopimelate desuccinylase-like protein